MKVLKKSLIYTLQQNLKEDFLIYELIGVTDIVQDSVIVTEEQLIKYNRIKEILK